jgi:hypothetical protein
MKVGHQHVSHQEIEALFDGRFRIEQVQFTGLFAPFITWLLTAGERTGMFSDRFVDRLNAFRAWEGGIPYPRALAYNVRLVARKITEHRGMSGKRSNS